MALGADLNSVDTEAAESRLRLEPGWAAQLGELLAGETMRDLSAFLRSELRAGKRIYPPGRRMFAAFDRTPFEQVKVVMLGQDPYHGAGQAHGLCFSVPPGVPVPPSLRNIYAELERDLKTSPPGHGCLEAWAERGVLLLNAVLSVEEGKPGSHAGRGWEGFTDAAIAALNRQRENLVFMLWGSYAQKKGALIDRQRHCVLRAPHPSPLSAHRGFIGCGHFGAANRYLKGAGLAPIDWSLPIAG